MLNYTRVGFFLPFFLVPLIIVCPCAVSNPEKAAMNFCMSSMTKPQNWWGQGNQWSTPSSLPKLGYQHPAPIVAPRTGLVHRHWQEQLDRDRLQPGLYHPQPFLRVLYMNYKDLGHQRNPHDHRSSNYSMCPCRSKPRPTQVSR